MTDLVDYDEFGLFGENAAEFGLPFDGPPVVRRAFAEVAPGRRLSALVWQDGDPELVLLHGGAQNAHTWDTVAMALDRPLVAIDLPGFGQSHGRQDLMAPRPMGDFVVRIAGNYVSYAGSAVKGSAVSIWKGTSGGSPAGSDFQASNSRTMRGSAEASCLRPMR